MALAELVFNKKAERYHLSFHPLGSGANRRSMFADISKMMLVEVCPECPLVGILLVKLTETINLFELLNLREFGQALPVFWREVRHETFGLFIDRNRASALIFATRRRRSFGSSCGS